MDRQDVRVLTGEVRAALWLCDVALETGTRTEIYATYFKDLTYIHVVQWVLRNIRKFIFASLSGERYEGHPILISKVSNLIPGFDAATRTSRTKWLRSKGEILLSPQVFTKRMRLEDFHLTRVDGEPGDSLSIANLAAGTLIHEVAYLIGTYDRGVMVEVINDPELERRLIFSSVHFWFARDAIVDVCLGHFALPESRSDDRVLSLDEHGNIDRVTRSRRRDATAYQRYAPYLAALEQGSLASIISADSYALLVTLNGNALSKSGLRTLAGRRIHCRRTSILPVLRTFRLGEIHDAQANRCRIRP